MVACHPFVALCLRPRCDSRLPSPRACEAAALARMPRGSGNAPEAFLRYTLPPSLSRRGGRRDISLPPSVRHPTVRHFVRLLQDPPYRQRQGSAVLDGRLVAELGRPGRVELKRLLYVPRDSPDAGRAARGPPFVWPTFDCRKTSV